MNKGNPNRIMAGDAWKHCAADGGIYHARVIMQGTARTLRVAWMHGGREVVRISAPMIRTRRNANRMLDDHLVPGWERM